MSAVAEDREATAKRLCDRLEIAFSFADPLGFSPETMLDLLWLLVRIDEPRESPGSEAEPEKSERSAETQANSSAGAATKTAATPQAETSDEPHPDNESEDESVPGDDGLGDMVPIYARPARSSAGGSRGVAVDLPAPAPFPNLRDFLKAWRPLWSRGPSRIASSLDVDATLRRWAAERILDPVTRSHLERQVELVVVVDLTPSMDPWRSCGYEIQRALAGCGGFRRVSVVGLAAGDVSPRLIASHRIGEPVAPEIALPRLDGGPHVTLFVTDLVSHVWNSPRWVERLDEWERKGAVAFLQPFPQRLWDRTALADAEAQNLLPWAVRNTSVSATSSGVTADRFSLLGEFAEIERPKFGEALHAVAPLHDQGRLARMARFFAGRGADPQRCYRLRIVDQVEDVAALDPDAAFDEFRLNASRAAQNLAVLLAASPAAMLPIARILQRSFLGGSADPVVEAEIWNAGLLEPLEEQHGEPDGTLYDFRPGLRDRFLKGAPADLRIQILQRTAEFIEQGLGRLHGLSAWIADPEGHPGALNDLPGADPLAVIAAHILRRQGGPLADIVRSKGRREAIDMTSLASQVVYGREGLPHRFCWSPDGSRIAIPSVDGRVSVTDVTTGEERSERGSSMGLNAVSWAPDGSRIAVACFTRVARIFSPDLREIAKLTGHNSDVTAVAFSPDGTWLATATTGGTVRIWHAARGTLLDSLNFDSGTMIRAVAWTGSDSLIAVNGSSAYALLLEPSDRLTVVRRFPIEATAVVAFRPTPRAPWKKSDQIVVAIGMPNGAVQIWDPTNDRKLTEFFPHRASIRSLDVSSDGRLLASKAKDGSVAVIRLSDRRVMARYESGAVASLYSTVAFRPGTSTLAVSEDERHRIRLFDLSRFVKTDQSKRLRIFACGQFGESHESRQSPEEGMQRCRDLGATIGRSGDGLAVASATTHSFGAAVLQGYLWGASSDGSAVLYTLHDTSSRQLDELTKSIGAVDPRGFAAAAVRAAFDSTSAEVALRTALQELTPESAMLEREFHAFTVGDLLGYADRQGLVDKVLQKLTDFLPANDRLRVAAKLLNGESGRRLDPRLRLTLLQDETSWGTSAWIRLLRSVDVVLAAEDPASDEETVQRLAEGYGIPFRRMSPNESAEETIVELEKEVAAAASRREQPPGHLARIVTRFGSATYWSTTGLAIDSRHVLTIRISKDGRSRRVESSSSSSSSHDDAEESYSVESIAEGNAQPAELIDSLPLSAESDIELSLLRTLRNRSVENGTRKPQAATRKSRTPKDKYSPPPAPRWRALTDSELLNAPALIQGIEESTRGQGRATHGIITQVLDDRLELWVDGLPSIASAGSLVTVRVGDEFVIVGMLTGGASSSETVSAVRVTDVIVSRIAQSVERSAEAFRRSVWVVGAGTHELPEKALAASRTIGRLLAEEGHRLLTGVYPGVDYVTAHAFVMAHEDAGNPAPEALLRLVMREGESPTFPRADVITVRRDADFVELDAAPCDALVVIGGFGGAMRAARSAIAHSIPVLPLLGTQGDADLLHEELTAGDAPPSLGLSAEDFMRATDWRKEPDVEALALLLRQLPKRAIPGRSS